MFQERDLLPSGSELRFDDLSNRDSILKGNLAGAMIFRIIRSSKQLMAVLSQHRKPSQIASGVSVGIMLGLIPKDNLVAVLLILVLACLRVNQLVACVTGLSLSLLGAWIAPFTALVGTSLLEQSLFANGIATLYRFPVVPWTCLDNALVVGGIGVGTATLVPSYFVFLWAFGHVNQKLESIALEQVANDAIQYRKNVVDQSTNRQRKPAKFNLILDESPAIDDLTPELDSSTPPLLSRDAEKQAIEPISSKKPISRFFGRSDAKKNQKRMPAIIRNEVLPDGTDTFLRETVIEVVRYRRPAVLANESVDSIEDSTEISQTQGNSMTVGNGSTMESKKRAADSSVLVNKSAAPGQSIAFDSGHHPGHAAKNDESLKYLLWHINGSRETVRKSSEKTA